MSKECSTYLLHPRGPQEKYGREFLTLSWGRKHYIGNNRRLMIAIGSYIQSYSNVLVKDPEKMNTM